MSSRILVTGGNGRLGRAVLAELGPWGVAGLRRGGDADAILIDSDGLVDPARLTGVTAIINCAGRVVGTHAEIEQSNIGYPVALARQARDAGVRRLVQVSSFSVYGRMECIDANSQLKPESDYGRSKLAAEQALITLSGPDFHVVSLRLPFMFSADNPALLGRLVSAISRLRVLPTISGKPSSRSMITYGGAAAALATLATCANAVDGVLVAADPQPLELVAVARLLRARLGRRVAVVPVPALLTKLVRPLAADMADRLLRSSVLASSSNWLAAGCSHPVAAELETYLDGLAV